VSNKMDKTAVVEVETTGRHSLYNKAVRRQRKFYAHDDANECRVGDIVRITETRPLSKLKRWRVVEVVERARE
jgi:small subunit ribosomal protein S17